jgi:quercetin dioxygenase-like cupin family protein
LTAAIEYPGVSDVNRAILEHEQFAPSNEIGSLEGRSGEGAAARRSWLRFFLAILPSWMYNGRNTGGAAGRQSWDSAEKIWREDQMKKSVLVLGVAALIIIVASSVVQARKASPAGGKKVVYVSADKADYKESPAKGVSMVALWGDQDKGAHATFSKFEPGYDAGMHTHTSDLWIVGVKGAYLYKDEAGEKRVGPGDYLFVPGGHKHWSGGDKTEGAVFYEEGAGKFDSVPAK